MSRVLVDTSVWIDFFNGKPEVNSLNELIDVNQVYINDLIKVELVPSLLLKKENEVIDLINQLESIPLTIDWNEIAQMQYSNLKKGINKVGIPDLIIIQNVLQNDLVLFSRDKHFDLMKKVFNYRLY